MARVTPRLPSRGDRAVRALARACGDVGERADEWIHQDPCVAPSRLTRDLRAAQPVGRGGANTESGGGSVTSVVKNPERPRNTWWRSRSGAASVPEKFT